MDIIMVGPWMLFSQNGLNHGHHHGWVMDALFSGRINDKTMHGILVEPWMLPSQNRLDHGRHHGWAMDAFFSERIR